MSQALDWQVIGNRSEALNVCRTLLSLARMQVAEDRRGGEGDPQ